MTRIKTLLMAAVIFAAFVLGGCGAASPMDTAEEIKTELGGYSSLTLTASITASYENCVYDFKIKCVSGDAGLEIEILEPERETAGGDVLMFPCGVFGYDRDSGQVREIWEPMVVEISGDSTQVASIAADAADGQAVMFILFNDENSGQDILLWKDGEEESMRLLDLQDDPRLQIRMSDGIYYCRDNGEILRCAISGDEQETLLYVGSGLETFLVTEDESRVFTVEMRGETEDICLYTRDGEGNWRKQVLYVGAEGARYLQLSADGSELLAECPGASGTMALVLSFGVSNAAE